jgi:hypothetical protein
MNPHFGWHDHLDAGDRHGRRDLEHRLPVPAWRRRRPEYLGISPIQGHIGEMKKSPRVIFSNRRIAEGDWQIEAHCPGAEIRYIKGLTSKADVDEWLEGERKIAWLRSQGYAK